ncbi:unnamed protein product, partial [Prorocentrum cordatum]
MSIAGGNGRADMISTTGAQMGFCLAPRDFNDCYNPVIAAWLAEDPNDANRLLKALCPVTKRYSNLSICTFMDDVTKLSMWEGGVTSYGIAAELNLMTKRCLAQGKCSWQEQDGNVRQLRKEEVFRKWKINRASDELRIRRLKWYQKWAAFPEAHSQVTAAVFGSTPLDLRHGTPRLEEGRISTYSTPWAYQYLQDLQYLRAQAGGAALGKGGKIHPPAPKYQRLGGGKRGGGSDEVDLVDAMVSLQKMGLRQDQRAREHEHMLSLFYMMTKKSKICQMGLEAGLDYYAAVAKRGKGHGLGAPYLHVAAGAFDGLVEDAQEGQHKAVLQAYQRLFHTEKGMKFVKEVFGSFRVKEAHNEEGTAEKDVKVKASFNLNPLADVAMLIECLKVKTEGDVPSLGILRRAMMLALEEAGGVQSDGPAPKDELTRVVERQMQGLQRMRGPEEAGGFFSGSDCDELEVDLEAELAGLLPDGLEQERAGLEADVGQGRPEAPREAQEERGLPEVDLEAELGDLLPDGLEEEPVASGGTELDGLFSEAEEANNQPEGREEPRPAPDPGSADLDGLFSDAEEPAPPAAAAPRQQEIAAAAPDADALPAEPGAAAEAGDQTSGPVTPPPPPPPPPEVPAGFATAQDRAAADVDFADESRYMEGPDGEKLLKWKVDYANRGGSGRAMCRDLDCLERHDQAGVRTIEKGALRIGRRVLMEKDSGTPQINIFWHHARCMFNTFLRSRKQTRVIQSEGDIEGFEALMPEDQDLLRRYISGNERGAGRAFDDGPAAKRQRPLLEVKGRVGDRVWTFCRVRPPAPPGGAPPALGGGPVKSAKAELGIVVAE